MPSLNFPMGFVKLSEKEYYDAQAPGLGAMIQRMGISSKMSRKIIHVYFKLMLSNKLCTVDCSRVYRAL